jgi:hypothetical protein
MNLVKLIQGASVSSLTLVEDMVGTPDENYWYELVLELPEQDQVQMVKVYVTWDDQGEHIFDLMTENGWTAEVQVRNNQTGETRPV